MSSRIEWDGRAICGPSIPLEDFAGARVDVTVDADSTALLVDDDAVRGVLMTGVHAVHVLEPDEDPGDVDARTFARRMQTDLEDLSWLRPRTRNVAPGARLRFVAAGTPVFVECGDRGPVIFEDPQRGPVGVVIEAVARLGVSDPVAFHEAFLRTTEELRSSDFEAIVGSLIEAGVARVLEAQVQSSGRAEPDPRTLAQQVVANQAAAMASIGLDLEALEITRLEFPTGPVTRPSTEPASLATPRDRR